MRKRVVEGVNKTGKDEVLWDGYGIADALWVLGRRAWSCRGCGQGRAWARRAERARKASGHGQKRAGDDGVDDDEKYSNELER